MLNPLLFGEIAGLVTAGLWSSSSLLFTFAGRTIGSLMVNRWRLAFATVTLLLVHTIAFGSPIPLGASATTWGWLILSALIGLVVGDSLLFRAYVILGPRSAMVLMTLAPVFSTLLAWLFLGEVLSFRQLSGIGITTAGVAWAISHHSRFVAPSREGSTLLGVVVGIGAALFQASGLILTRKGLDSGILTFSANLIRMGSAAAMLWLFTLVMGQAVKSVHALRNKSASLQVALGSVIGPTLGAWLSIVAVRYAPVGVASSLMSTTPILMIPLSMLFLKEHVRFQSILGTFIAISGVVLLLTSSG